jgi:hypothetical protein
VLLRDGAEARAGVDVADGLDELQQRRDHDADACSGLRGGVWIGQLKSPRRTCFAGAERDSGWRRPTCLPFVRLTLARGIIREALAGTRPHTSPVMLATSPAVIAPPAESAPSTFALVAPGAVRARELPAPEEGARLRGAADDRSGVLAAATAGRSAGLGVRFRVDFGAGCSRRSTAASALRSFSASATSCSRRSWMS